MRYNISFFGLLIIVNHLIGSISNLVAVCIEFLVQNLLAVDDLSFFKVIFQGLCAYRFKSFVLEFYRQESLLLKIWLFDCFLVVFRQEGGFDLRLHRLRNVLRDYYHRQIIGQLRIYLIGSQFVDIFLIYIYQCLFFVIRYKTFVYDIVRRYIGSRMFWTFILYIVLCRVYLFLFRGDQQAFRFDVFDIGFIGRFLKNRKRRRQVDLLFG